MQKKIFSLLVLLMTAVSGAWADNTVTWGSAELSSLTDDQLLAGATKTVNGITVTVNAGTNNFIAVSPVGTAFSATNDNAFTFSTELGNFTKIECTSVYLRGTLGDGWDGATWTGDANSVNMSNAGSDLVVSSITFTIGEPAAPAADIPVTPTENKNEWTFTMPDYAVVANVEYDTELALSEVDDNAAKLAEWDGYEANVTLTRTLVTGGWNTLAVPFNVSSDALTALNTILTAKGGSFTVKQLTSSEIDGKTLTLNFEDADEMEAGKPYLVKVTKDVNLASLSAAIDAAIALGQFSANPFKDAVISKALVPVTTTYADFIPTLGKTTIGSENDDPKTILFVAAGNLLKNPAAMPAYMKGFRAYFQLKNLPAEARTFALNLGDESTGIAEIENGKLNIENGVYDLQGRRMESSIFNTQSSIMKKGVYIVNGKKVIK